MAISPKAHTTAALRAPFYLTNLVTLSLLAWPMASLAHDRFLSTKPTPREEYWQVREAEIARQLSNGKDLPRYKLVFIGDSITDFWRMHEDHWVKGLWHGGKVWDETFGGGDPAYYALNLGISGDRTEHMLYRLMPKSVGGQGELESPDLAPDYLVIMAGINNSWAPEPKTADAIFAGVEAVAKLTHLQKPEARIILQSILPTLDPAKNCGS
jgi:lysophospholipase L1-like esterase